LKYWAKRTEIPLSSFTTWLEISSSKFYNWQKRYGKENMHNAHVPRDFWLEDWEKEAIIEFHYQYPLEGYRRLSFMMLDQDVVAASPSTVYRVLSQSGLLRRWNNRNPSSKGTGFTQPANPHEHWHIDIAYLNVCGTFYYLCTIIDGYSRYIVHWEIRESMKEADVEIILQRAKEKYSQVTPRVISDNGPQFISKDFKEFIRISGMTHVRTAPYYPQSNGKIERYHRTIKEGCIRPGVILSLTDARDVVEKFVVYYNNVRLHSAIGYVTPESKLEGRERHIFKERDQKLEAARVARKSKRQSLRWPPKTVQCVKL
jgi:transposase InsO family protein